MTGGKLGAEYLDALEALARRPDMLRWLVETFGAKTCTAAGWPGIGRVVLPRRRGDLYRPARDGEAAEIAVIMPVERPAWCDAWIEGVERTIELADLCAWAPGAPHRWGLRTGNASALGEGHLLWAETLATVPTLHSSPADWLRARGEGACILRTDRSVAFPLAGRPEVTCRWPDAIEVAA